MVFNSTIITNALVLKCGVDITMIDGSTTTRIIDLGEYATKYNIQVENIYVVPYGSFTYQSAGTSVTSISYMYSNGLITVVYTNAVLNANWQFDKDNWIVVIKI